MKTILEYLSAKVKPHKNHEFPNFPSRKEFIGFLDYIGFKKLKNPDRDVDEYLEDEAKTSKTPIYVTEEIDYAAGVHWVRFCNQGPITYNNQILFCYLTDDFSNLKEFQKYIKDNIEANFIGYNVTTGKEIKNWEDFEEEFKKFNTIA